jgi:hypothetical protein
MSGRELFRPYEVKNQSDYSSDIRSIARVEKEVGTEILHSIPSESGLHIFKVSSCVEVCFATPRYISGIYFTGGSRLHLRLREVVAARSPKEAREVIKTYLKTKAHDELWSSWSIETLSTKFTKKRTTEAALCSYLATAIIHTTAEACFGDEEDSDAHLVDDEESESKQAQMTLL